MYLARVRRVEKFMSASIVDPPMISQDVLFKKPTCTMSPLKMRCLHIFRFFIGSEIFRVLRRENILFGFKKCCAK